MSNRSQTRADISITEMSAAISGERLQSTSAQTWLPFHLVEPAVFAADFVLIVGISLLTGLGYHRIFLNLVPDIEPYVAIGILTFSNFAAILAARGDYRFRNLVNFKRQAIDITIIWIGIFLFLLAVGFSLKIEGNYSRGATLGYFVFGLSSLIAWRGILAHLLTKALTNGAFAEHKIVVIGERSRLASSRDLRELRRYGYKPVSIFEITEDESKASGMPQTLQKTLHAAIEIARQGAVEEIILIIGWEHSRCIESILNILSILPVPVHLLPDDNVARYLNRRMFHVGATWTAELKRAPLSKREQALKRSIDVLAASTSILLLSPLMLLTALLIKLDSSGPVLFTQLRDGFNGRSFRIFKFRTMAVLEDGACVRQASRNDPRFTRLGRWLRRSNIDELPQLFNVLRGEMSLVGPRPHAAVHNSEYGQRIAAYAFRYHVKPGISGWAQVNGYRGETRTLDLMEKRVELDLWYINNWSILLDVKILLRTLVLGLQASAY
jgi:undecaprenyl-phosphate galactose phosphotransferase/putative colanic acid biosynthesis UDP-glucose lipid carrier transferase